MGTFLGLLGRVIGLEFAPLVGLRTKLGIVAAAIQPVVDQFADGALCASMPKTCAIVQGVGAWFVVAGIYGKR